MNKFFDFLYKIIDDIKEKRFSFFVVSLAVSIITFFMCQKFDASSFLTAIATCGLVWVSIQQIKIQRSQNNLALFEKRWAFWEETKRLRSDVIKCDRSDIEKYGPVFNHIKELERKSLVLFGEDIRKEFEKISKTFEDLTEGKPQFDEAYKIDLGFESRTYDQLIKQFDDIAPEIFEKIKGLKV